MKTILLVASDRRELAGVARHCRRLERLDWPLEYAARGELGGQRVLMVANGLGRARAAAAVATACGRERVDAVVSAGWCGALDPELAPGEILVAGEVQAAGETVSYTAGNVVARRGCRCGGLLTVDAVAGKAEEKNRLRRTGAAAVDMEAAAVAAESGRLGVPFFCVRVVLDRAGESFDLDFNAARTQDGRLSRMRILRAVLARPWIRLPELLRWAGRSRRAAQVLGDFLAECSFEL